MRYRTKASAEERKTMAGVLRRLAHEIEGDDTITKLDLEVNRPPRELDPMRGECPFDTMRHYAPGPETTLTLKVVREP